MLSRIALDGFRGTGFKKIDLNSTATRTQFAAHYYTIGKLQHDDMLLCTIKY